MNLLLACAWLLPTILGTGAQRATLKLLTVAKQKSAPEQVYTYAEQMPQLPGGGGTQQIAAEIMKRTRLSGKIEPSCYRTMVYFEVSPTGVVQHARVATASQSPAVDAALLRAVRSLPTLRPGYQQGKPITVSFTMPFRTATQ